MRRRSGAPDRSESGPVGSRLSPRCSSRPSTTNTPWTVAPRGRRWPRSRSRPFADRAIRSGTRAARCAGGAAGAGRPAGPRSVAAAGAGRAAGPRSAGACRTRYASRRDTCKAKLEVRAGRHVEAALNHLGDLAFVRAGGHLADARRATRHAKRHRRLRTRVKGAHLILHAGLRTKGGVVGRRRRARPAALHRAEREARHQKRPDHRGNCFSRHRALSPLGFCEGRKVSRLTGRPCFVCDNRALIPSRR